VRMSPLLELELLVCDGAVQYRDVTDTNMMSELNVNTKATKSNCDVYMCHRRMCIVILLTYSLDLCTVATARSGTVA